MVIWVPMTTRATHPMSSSTHPPLPPLSLPQVRAVQVRMAKATADLKVLMEEGGSGPSVVAFQGLLAQGACFETLDFPGHGRAGAPDDLWQRILDLDRLDLFSLLLEADAARETPDHHSASLIARVAAHDKPAYLDALLAHTPPLNQKGRTPFLWKAKGWNTTQLSTGLIGALVGKNDGALDRLLDAGADPRGALDPPVYGKRPQNSYAPLSLLHFAQTPRAVRRLVAAGLDVNAEDELGRTALERVFDNLCGTKAATPQQRKDLVTEATALAEALLDSGARTEGPEREGGRPSWSAMVRAAQADLVPLMVLLQSRGVDWPGERCPVSPDEAHRILSRGVVLPLASHGTGWLVSWALDDRFPWHLAAHTAALKPLAQQGLNLDAVDPKTGLNPLVACLRSGAYEALGALVEAGMDLKGYPGIWNKGLTWDRFLHITICLRVWGEVHEQSVPPASWWKVSPKLLIGTGFHNLGPTLRRALSELGNHPGVAAELQRQRLETQVATWSAAQESRPRL